MSTLLLQTKRQAALAPARVPPQRPPIEIGRTDDPTEHEADRVAAQLLRTPEPVRLQRSPGAPSAGIAPPIVHDVLSTPGRPLDAATRGRFESRLGADLSGVRIHDDNRALRSANAVGAQAYTVGNHIAFGAVDHGAGGPESNALLAHELTHVVQQRGAPARSLQRKLAVGAGLSMDTKGYTTSKSGNEYTCPAIAKNTIWHELFTSLLFSPRVFKIAGTTNAEIDTNLDKHIMARYGIVDFASKKKYSFAAGAAFKMNPAYWIVDATGWRLKPGVSHDEAIKDLNVNPKEYAIACLAATSLTMQSAGSPLADDTAVAPDDWIPGDWGYILNTNFPAGGTPGLEGENIIYTGKDKFWGHFGPGIEYKLLTDWFDQVKSWHGGALIETSRTRPTIGLL